MTLTITQVNLPQSKYEIKCPFVMDPDGITMHNTANDASAMAEISYMQGNPHEVSFHYAVDDVRAVQGLDLNRNGWHAGDGGKGKGNRNTIGIEICYSKSGGGSFTKAEKNAAELVARILKSKGWGINKVGKHQDYWQGTYYKYCPHRTLDLGWQRFLNMVQEELNKLNGKTTSTPKTNLNVGQEVEIVDALYLNSEGAGRSTASKGKRGKIDRVVSSGKRYHVKGDGFSGWAHENDIKAVAKKVIYQTKTGRYEALRDDTFFIEPQLKNRSSINIKKGQIVCADEVVKIAGRDGIVYTRGKWRLGKYYRYFTLRDDFFKKI